MTKRLQSLSAASADEAFVEVVGNARLLEKRDRIGRVSDELPVRRGVGDEVAGRGEFQQRRYPVLRRQDRHRVEQDRRAAFELLVGVDARCRRESFTPPTSGATSLSIAPSAFNALRSASRAGRVDAIGDQSADLAPARSSSAPFRTMLSARTKLQVHAGRPGGGRAAWASPSDRRPSATVSPSSCVDIQQMRDHAAADRGSLHLARARTSRRRRCAPARSRSD